MMMMCHPIGLVEFLMLGKVLDKGKLMPYARVSFDVQNLSQLVATMKFVIKYIDGTLVNVDSENEEVLAIIEAMKENS